MGLPDLIEIMPLGNDPLEAHVTMPGSKSITNRALVLAALATLPASAQLQLKILGYFQNTFSHQTQLKT